MGSAGAARGAKGSWGVLPDLPDLPTLPILPSFLPNMATSQLQPEFTVVGAQATRTAHCRGQVFSPWNDHKFLTCVYATTQVCDDRIYALDTRIQHAGSWIKRQVKDMDSAK